MLDAWIYANGIGLGKDIDLGQSFFNKTPLQALKDCTYNQDESSCQLMEEFSAEMGTENIQLWRMFQENLYDGFIPLCSYATKNLTLKKCTSFKKMNFHQCFTFNESSFIPRLGRTQGLNFLVNYDYPGTRTEMNEPIMISLHEPSQPPDINDVKGKNFYASPGHILDLKISTTVIDSTKDFDAMSTKNKGCGDNTGHGEVDCITQKIIQRSESTCACQPWYINDTNTDPCDTLGTICYKESIENGTGNLDLQHSCDLDKPCKHVKYNLDMLRELPMTECCIPKSRPSSWDSLARDTLLNFESYGDEFTNNLFKSERLFRYLGDFHKRKDFLTPKLERMSLIHINFEEANVFSVTKDAKITTADMIGNIGGTLGVFIGFSFLGLLETLIDMVQYLHQRRMSIKKKCSESTLEKESMTHIETNNVMSTKVEPTHIEAFESK